MKHRHRPPSTTRSFPPHISACLVFSLAIAVSACTDRTPLGPDDGAEVTVARVFIEELPRVVGFLEPLDSPIRLRVEATGGGTADWSGLGEVIIYGQDTLPLDTLEVQFLRGEGILEGVRANWLTPSVTLEAQAAGQRSQRHPLEIDIGDEVRPVFTADPVAATVGCDMAFPEWSMAGIPSGRPVKLHPELSSSDETVIAVGEGGSVHCVGRGFAMLQVEVAGRVSSLPVVVNDVDQQWGIDGPTTIHPGELAVVRVTPEGHRLALALLDYEVGGDLVIQSVEASDGVRCAVRQSFPGGPGRLTIFAERSDLDEGWCEVRVVLPEWTSKAMAALEFQVIRMRDINGDELDGDREVFGWSSSVMSR